MIGSLVTIKGTVIKAFASGPELLFGTFRCLDCGQLVKDVEQQFQITLVIINIITIN